MATMKKAASLFVGGLMLLAGASAPVAAAPASEQAEGTLYVIPIKDVIDNALIYVIRRGLREAEAAQASAIIFDMDTPGGRLDSAEEILSMLRGLKVPTYTFVNPNAISAGAIIAMATDHIYMTPGSKIGDAMPIMISVFGEVQSMSESLEEKSVSYVAAMIRAAAQHKGHDPQLAEAMVRRDSEYKIGDEVIAKKGQLLTLTNKDAERRVGKDNRPLLSEGTVQDLDGLVEKIGRTGDKQVILEVTTAEEIARMIESFSVIILALGLLGLYIEFKTPGFGLPGILGIALLAIWFWGYHIAGLAGFEEMALFLVGLGLVLFEIFFIPGFGWAGLAGMTLIAISILMAMVEYYPGEPWYPVFPKFEAPLMKLGLSFVLSVVGMLVVARFLPHSSLFQKLVLQSATDRKEGFVAADETTALIGRRGVTQTQLRPAGTAVFDGERRQVVTRGDFLDAGQEIVIVEAHGNRIIVEEATS
jgi:membrane-bound serine protease (ClpP class)